MLLLLAIVESVLRINRIPCHVMAIVAATVYLECLRSTNSTASTSHPHLTRYFHPSVGSTNKSLHFNLTMTEDQDLLAKISQLAGTRDNVFSVLSVANLTQARSIDTRTSLTHKDHRVMSFSRASTPRDMFPLEQGVLAGRRTEDDHADVVP